MFSCKIGQQWQEGPSSSECFVSGVAKTNDDCFHVLFGFQNVKFYITATWFWLRTNYFYGNTVGKYNNTSCTMAVAEYFVNIYFLRVIVLDINHIHSTILYRTHSPEKSSCDWNNISHHNFYFPGPIFKKLDVVLLTQRDWSKRNACILFRFFFSSGPSGTHETARAQGSVLQQFFGRKLLLPCVRSQNSVRSPRPSSWFMVFLACLARHVQIATTTMSLQFQIEVAGGWWLVACGYLEVQQQTKVQPKSHLFVSSRCSAWCISSSVHWLSSWMMMMQHWPCQEWTNDMKKADLWNSNFHSFFSKLRINFNCNGNAPSSWWQTTKDIRGAPQPLSPQENQFSTLQEMWASVDALFEPKSKRLHHPIQAKLWALPPLVAAPESAAAATTSPDLDCLFGLSPAPSSFASTWAIIKMMTCVGNAGKNCQGRSWRGSSVSSCLCTTKWEEKICAANKSQSGANTSVDSTALLGRNFIMAAESTVSLLWNSAPWLNQPLSDKPNTVLRAEWSHQKLLSIVPSVGWVVALGSPTVALQTLSKQLFVVAVTKPLWLSSCAKNSASTFHPPLTGLRGQQQISKQSVHAGSSVGVRGRTAPFASVGWDSTSEKKVANPQSFSSRHHHHMGINTQVVCSVQCRLICFSTSHSGSTNGVRAHEHSNLPAILQWLPVGKFGKFVVADNEFCMTEHLFSGQQAEEPAKSACSFLPSKQGSMSSSAPRHPTKLRKVEVCPSMFFPQHGVSRSITQQTQIFFLTFHQEKHCFAPESWSWNEPHAAVNVPRPRDWSKTVILLAKFSTEFNGSNPMCFVSLQSEEQQHHLCGIPTAVLFPARVECLFAKIAFVGCLGAEPLPCGVHAWQVGGKASDPQHWSSLPVEFSTIFASTTVARPCHWRGMMKKSLHWFKGRTRKRNSPMWTQLWNCTSSVRLTGEHVADHNTKLHKTRRRIDGRRESLDSAVALSKHPSNVSLSIFLQNLLPSVGKAKSLLCGRSILSNRSLCSWSFAWCSFLLLSTSFLWSSFLIDSHQTFSDSLSLLSSILNMLCVHSISSMVSFFFLSSGVTHSEDKSDGLLSMAGITTKCICLWKLTMAVSWKKKQLNWRLRLLTWPHWHEFRKEIINLCLSQPHFFQRGNVMAIVAQMTMRGRVCLDCSKTHEVRAAQATKTARPTRTWPEGEFPLPWPDLALPCLSGFLIFGHAG